MRTTALLSLFCTFLLLSAAASPQVARGAASDGGPVVVLTQDGAIGPANADYLIRGLARAQALGAQLVVIRMDTPGGLDLSMRAIIRHILASPVPVASLVAPNGARAASAGTYILYASHFAAMAPASNLGAATPVSLGPEPKPDAAPESRPGEPARSASKPGSDAQDGKGASKTAPIPGDAMARKQTNDAAAYIRSLAQLRGRNAEWAERAVREAVSLSAAEALQLKVIDLIAPDVPQLLKALDGRRIDTVGGTRQLATAGAAVIELRPDWRTSLLATITDPGIAYILLMAGFYGLLFEFLNPGMVAPGVIGGICLLVALFALQLLPVSYTGLGLIALGVALLVAEHFAPGFGVLGTGGIVALVLGSVMLFDTGDSGYRVPWRLIAAVAVAGAALLFVALRLAMGARRRPVVSGREQLIGAQGEVVNGGDEGDTAGGEGGLPYARIGGEMWRVRTAATASGAALSRGRRVKVVGIDGLVLVVQPEEA